MRHIIILLAILLSTFEIIGQEDKAMKVGEEVIQLYESPHPYKSSETNTPEIVFSQEINFKKASYIAVHFDRVELSKDDFIVVKSPNGERSWKYSNLNVKSGSGGLWSVHIYGETAIIEIHSKNKKGSYGYSIDKIAKGFTTDELKNNDDEAICGEDDTEEAKCYQSTEPQVYDRSRAVARLLINGTGACTGWLIGSDGHLMTNNHCVGNANDANDVTIEFMAEGDNCDTNCQSWFGCPGTIEATSTTLVQTDQALDYSLLALPNNVSGTYGFLQLRESGPILNERIYIPQHPAAWGKRIALVSDTGASGFPTVTSLSEPRCTGSGNGDIGYFADTRGGSSGSPVISYGDNLVVALHHCANCPNRGVASDDIISDLGNNLPNNAVGTTTTDCAIELVSFTKSTNSSTNCDTYTLTMESSATTAATIQITNLPGNGFSEYTVGVGSLSWGGQTGFNWNIPANSFGSHTATFKYCWAAGASAQATFNDGDGICDSVTVGDPCAGLGGDTDGDGVCDVNDNCPNDSNADQADADGDGVGDVCDSPCDSLGGDTDGDGVCANVDCDDNDPNVPTTPGTSCDDGDANTTGDIIQADGCTCQGTTISDCAIKLVSFTKTTNSSTNCDTYTLTMESSATTAATIQITNLPGNGFSEYTVGVGSLSWGGQTGFNWNIPANSFGSHTATFKYCWAAGASAQATFNDGDGICDSVTVGDVDPCAGLGGDTDRDGICDDNDNCPNDSNADQADADGNGVGDVCDIPPPTGCNGVDFFSFERNPCASPQCNKYELIVASSNSNPMTIQITDLPTNGYAGYTGPGTLTWAGQGAWNWNLPDGLNEVTQMTITYEWAADATPRATYSENGCTITKVVDGGNKVILNPDDISLFPNPAENEVYLNLEALAGNQGTVAISNSLGQVVQSTTFDEIPNDPVQLDISQHNSGLYFVSIKTDDNQRIIKKLLINKFD